MELSNDKQICGLVPHQQIISAIASQDSLGAKQVKSWILQELDLHLKMHTHVDEAIFGAQALPKRQFLLLPCPNGIC